ncbi:MAG: hypothetical protein NXI04_08375 [Planctomycetaceae bacterium]|nr:hypothetical protein [Planctomycetaceae bacterium]
MKFTVGIAVCLSAVLTAFCTAQPPQPSPSPTIIPRGNVPADDRPTTLQEPSPPTIGPGPAISPTPAISPSPAVSPTPASIFDEPADAVVQPQIIESKPQAAPEWAPRLRIFITLQSDESPGSDPAARVRYFSSRTAAAPPVEVRPARTTNTSPTIATLACDDISLSTDADDATVKYHFETQSRCRLLLSDLRIDADSMKLEDGVLTIINATTTTKDKTTMHAEQMTIPLNPVAISTGMFGKPVSALQAPVRVALEEQPKPAPGPAFSTFGSPVFPAPQRQ